MGPSLTKYSDVIANPDLEVLDMTCKKVTDDVEYLRRTSEQMQKCIEELEDALQEMKEKISTQQKNTKSNSKNISNKH